MEYLSKMEVTTQEDHVSTVSKSDTDDSELTALLREDRERRYFVSSSFVTSASEAIERTRWEKGDMTRKVQFRFTIPKVAEDTTRLVAILTGTTEIAKIHCIWRNF